jgi:hypothetical protein
VGGVNSTSPEEYFRTKNFVIYARKMDATVRCVLSSWFWPGGSPRSDLQKQHLKIMAKKNDTTETTNSKTAAPVKPTAPAVVAKPTAPVAPAKRAIKPAAAKTKAAPKSVVTPAVKAKRTPKAKAPVPKKAPSYSQDDVALRAYFISEKRRAHGLPGDEHQDWLEAERQIIAESTKSKRAKKT